MHKCPVGDCPIHCSEQHLMCRTHWFSIPSALRNRVNLLWRRLKAGDEDAADPYRTAREEAIAAAESAR